MPPPAKRVKATKYKRDSPEVAKLCLRLIAETDARSIVIAILLVLNTIVNVISVMDSNMDSMIVPKNVSK